MVVGTPTYFARVGEPNAPGDLSAHEAVIYDQGGGGADWTLQRDDANIAVTLKGRLRVSAAEGVRAAVLANAGLAIASEWMFAPEIADSTVKIVLQDWELPRIDLWAVFPAGRTTTLKPASSPSSSKRSCVFQRGLTQSHEGLVSTAQCPLLAQSGHP